MAGVERFEDLLAWQRARMLTKNVYAATRTARVGRDYGLSSQMQRAAVSIMANIAEGFERARAAEFHQFLSTAKASCAELRSHLYVALDAGLITPEQFRTPMLEAEDVARILGALRAAVERRKIAAHETAADYSLLSTQHSALSTLSSDA